MINRIDQTPLRISTNISRVRTTPKRSFGTLVKEHQRNILMTKGLSVSGAREVADGQTPSSFVDQMVLAAPFVPGGAILSAAISGSSQSTSTTQDDDSDD